MSWQSRAFSGLPVIGLLTLAYFIAGKFGLLLASLHASASPVWPPAGIALAALLLLGYRAWPAIFVGAFLVNVTTAGNVATSLASASGNTLEAVCGAWLVNRFAGGTTVFDRPQGVFKFALAAVLSTVISPAFGVTSLALTGFADWTNYGAIWLTWWLGDTTGDLLIAPLIILWSISSKRRWNRREAVEVGILLLLLFVLSETVFGGWLTISVRNYPMGLISGPIVIWMAFRFTQRETATGIFILSAIAIWGTLHGFGPFVGEAENQSLLALQSWTAVLTISAIALSAGMAERGRAQAALRESEERFRIVADAAPVLIWMSGLDKLCTFFSKPWLEFTGRTMEQEMGNGWAEGVHPDDFQNCLKTYVEAFDARKPFVMQYRLRRHDGEYRWISDTGVPRYDTDKNFAGYIGSCVDITELRSKEEALREFEERVVLAAEAAHLGVWELDTATNEVWMSDSARALFRFDSNTRIDHATLQDRVHPKDRALRESAVKAAIEAQREYQIEYRVLLPDGTLRWIGGRGRCVPRPDAKGIRVIGVSIDITPWKQAQDLFRMATEASPSGIILVNEQGRIVLVNTHVEELFGYRREELVGKLVDILLPERFANEHPVHRAQFIAAPTARPMGAGRELFARRKDGSEFPVEIGLNPVETQEGILVLAVVVDIAARKFAEAEALQHQAQLGHLSRVAVLGELAASIAHELNQPLSGIISNASAGVRFIDRGDVDLREMRDLLADIVADGRRAGDVIRGVRSMVKKGDPAWEPVNLSDLVTNVVRMLNSDAMLHSCKLETLLDPHLPAIEGDPVQLQQVLLNLVINAFDAMRDTPPSRRKVVIATGRNEDGTIRTSVRDYGIGIPEEMRERLFDHFVTTKAEGLGLGLGIVRSIVESHGGTVAAENVDGGGARFHFTLPANDTALR
jgi:PAS domain S-box-containing protein